MEQEDYCKTCRYPDFQGCYFCKISTPNEDGTPYGYRKGIPTLKETD